MTIPRALIIASTLALVSVAYADKPNERLSDAARGEQLYVRHCMACHGAAAAGDGPVAAALVGGVPDVRSGLTDDALEAQVDVILEGRSRMPGYSLSFDRYDARRVWRHMQRIASPETASEGATGG